MTNRTRLALLLPARCSSWSAAALRAAGRARCAARIGRRSRSAGPTASSTTWKTTTTRSPSSASAAVTGTRTPTTKGSTVWPVPGDQGGTFTMVEGGHDSKFAAEMKGKLAGKSIVYAAMGLNFMDPKEPLQRVRVRGHHLLGQARREHGRQARQSSCPTATPIPTARFAAPASTTTATPINVGEQWKRFVLPFSDLRQEPDWGAPRKPHIDSGEDLRHPLRGEGAGRRLRLLHRRHRLHL